MDPLGWVLGCTRTLPLFRIIRYRVYQHWLPFNNFRRKGAQSQSTLFFFQPGRRSSQASGEGSNSKKIPKSLDVQTPENSFGHLPKTTFSGWKLRNALNIFKNITSILIYTSLTSIMALNNRWQLRLVVFFSRQSYRKAKEHHPFRSFHLYKNKVPNIHQTWICLGSNNLAIKLFYFDIVSQTSFDLK